mgnify:CR=1 FL=1|jgi:subtilisin family serine protease
MTGRPVRVAVIDSGVSLPHPHIGTIAAGVTIRPDGSTTPDYFDRLGHGTAVAAAIQERAPRAELLVVKVFDWELSASVETLVSAIAWAASQHVDLTNLSLGTRQPDQANRLQKATSDAMRSGTLVVAARGPDGVDYLPGSLDGVVPVELDWDCPRLAVSVDDGRDGRPRCRASGYPRPAPDEDVENELRGLSLAVANVTGLLAQHLPADRRRSVTTAIEVLRRVQREFSPSDEPSRMLGR